MEQIQAYGPRGNFNPFSNSDMLSRVQEKVVKDLRPYFEGKSAA